MNADDRDTDVRLQAALRHAPDAGIEPAPALDRRILDAARRAVPGAGGKPARRWFAWLDALTRPAGAAAFASLLLGTTIALLWRGEVPPEAMPGAPAEVGAPTTQRATQPTTRPTSETANSELRAAAPASAAAAGSAVATTVATNATPPASAAYRARAAKVAPQPATPSPPVQVGSTVRPEITAKETPPMPTPALAAPPAPPPSPSAPETPAPVRDESAAAEQTAAAAPAGAPMRSAAQRSAVKAEQASAARKSAQPVPALDPVAPTLAALGDATAAAQILRELQAAAKGRWTAVSAPAPAAGDLLVRDASGRMLARLRLDGDGVIWQPLAAPAGAWRVTLDTGTAQALRDRLLSAGSVTEPPPAPQPGR